MALMPYQRDFVAVRSNHPLERLAARRKIHISCDLNHFSRGEAPFRRRSLSLFSLDLMRHGEVRQKHRRRCVHSMVLIDEPKDRIGGLPADRKGECEMCIFILLDTFFASDIASYSRSATPYRT